MLLHLLCFAKFCSLIVNSSILSPWISLADVCTGIASKLNSDGLVGENRAGEHQMVFIQFPPKGGAEANPEPRTNK